MPKTNNQAITDIDKPGTSGLSKNSKCTRSKKAETGVASGSSGSSMVNSSGSDCSDDFKKYTKCPRVEGSNRGVQYEAKIAALLSLRCIALEDTKNIKLLTNAKDIGSFDDIILAQTTQQGDTVVYMVQTHHELDPKNIPTGGFKKATNNHYSLFKYWKSFKELQEKIVNVSENEPEIIKYLRKAKKITYIIFTNKYEPGKCNFLETIDDNSLNFLNTATDNKYLHKLNCEKFLNELDESTKKLFCEDNAPDCGFSKFLENLVLFTNQIYGNNIDHVITKAIKELVQGLSEFLYWDATKNYVVAIGIWARDSVNTKDGKTHYLLTKRDIVNKLTDAFLETYKYNLKTESSSLEDYHPENVNIWHKLIKKKSVTIVDDDGNVSTFIKEYICSKISKYCLDTKTPSDIGSPLSELETVTFYKKYRFLNSEMFKIVGNEEISMLDIYKCLWFIKKLPLLLEINGHAKHYDNIVNILKLPNYKLKVIVVNKGQPLSFNISQELRFISLNDLKYKDWHNILNYNSIKSPEKPPIPFKKVVSKKNLYEHVMCKDIINFLLWGKFDITLKFDANNGKVIVKRLKK